MVVLVASIPIALPVVATSTMAVGAQRLAQSNAVVTRLAAIEELAGIQSGLGLGLGLGLRLGC